MFGGKRQKNHNWGKFVWTAATHLGSFFPWFTFSISSTLSHSNSPWGHLTWYGSPQSTPLPWSLVMLTISQAKRSLTTRLARIPRSLCASQSQHNYHVNLPCGAMLIYAHALRYMLPVLWGAAWFVGCAWGRSSWGIWENVAWLALFYLSSLLDQGTYFLSLSFWSLKVLPISDISSGGGKVYLIFTQINTEPCQWPQFSPLWKFWLYLHLIIITFKKAMIMAIVQHCEFVLFFFFPQHVPMPLL